MRETREQRGTGRLLICLAVGLAGAIGCAPGSTPAAPRARASILLITLDTLRADHLGCYGYSLPTSPTIDALAARGVLFEKAIAQSAVTPVSHASILTGMWPYHHGLRSLHGGVGHELPEQVTTLAEIGTDSGYETAGFVSAFPATRHYGLQQGFSHWDQAFDLDPDQPPVGADGIINTGRSQRRGDETTDAVLAWLEGRDRARPFLCWVHSFDVHDPLLLPPDAFLDGFLGRFPPSSASRPDRLRAIYDAEIAFVDQQIQRLVERLEQLGRLEDTWIAILADHGQGLGDHHWWGHGILYQEQIHVPFILVPPGNTPVTAGAAPRGRRIADLVRTIDLVPTLCDALDLHTAGQAAFDGHSLTDLLDGGATSPGLAYAETINDLAAYPQSALRDDSIYALTDGRWKFVLRREKSRDKESLLFDLEADPGEHRNVAADAGRRDLTARFRSHLEKLGALLDDPPAPTLDEATRARLRELGYAGGK